MSNSSRVLFILISLSLFALLGVIHPTSAQTADPTPTPDLTLQALQNDVTLLSTQVALFNDKVDIHQQAANNLVEEQLRPYLIWATLLSAVGALCGAIGVGVGLASPIVAARYIYTKSRDLTRQFEKSTEELLQQAEKKTEERLNLAIYRADPTYLPIHIPETLEVEIRRLTLLGFRSVRPYGHLTSAVLEGIVVHPAKDLTDVATLKSFIADHRSAIEPRRVAFVIYSPGRIEGGETIYETYESVTFANNVVTIATHIYALARGLA